MGQFYFDIETTGFNPEKDDVITIQYQKLDYDGKPIDELKILKAWKGSEQAIVELVHRMLIQENSWGFIPIGTNLIFDLTFIWAKFKKYKLKCPDLAKFLYDKPLIDIKYTLIMANKLSFRGSGLDQMTKKSSDGKNVPIWYENKEYDKIEDYIKQETGSFIEFLQKLLKELPKLKK